MSKIAIVGAGMTKFSEHWQLGLRELTSKAVNTTLKSVDNGIDHNDIGMLFVSNVHGESLNNQSNVGALAADAAGFASKPGVRIEFGAASGSEAIRQAYNQIKSGLFDTVMVIGVEKMTDITDGGELSSILSKTLDYDWENQTGLTLPAAYAIMARAHMEKYGTTREELSAVVEKNHANAVTNPFAQYRRAFPRKVISNSMLVSEPLRMFDCAPASDGAAALIITKGENAKKYTDTPVWINGCGIGGDTFSLHSRKELYTMEAANRASKIALKMAGISIGDIKLAELQDDYSISELIQLESIGFFKAGEAGKATLNGETAINGKISVNPSGGLKAQGYPMGASGVAQGVEMWRQLRKEVDEKRQVNAEIGLTSSIAGTGNGAVVNIFGI